MNRSGCHNEQKNTNKFKPQTISLEEEQIFPKNVSIVLTE